MDKYKKGISKSKLLWLAVIIGFAIMEFPGIFFINRIDPIIFGFPFIYGIMIIMWFYMCIVLLIAYKLNWGKASCFKEVSNDVEYKEGVSKE